MEHWIENCVLKLFGLLIRFKNGGFSQPPFFVFNIRTEEQYSYLFSISYFVIYRFTYISHIHHRFTKRSLSDAFLLELFFKTRRLISSEVLQSHSGVFCKLCEIWFTSTQRDLTVVRESEAFLDFDMS